MASVCNAQFTKGKFEAAVRNSLQIFIHTSGLKLKHTFCLEIVWQKHNDFSFLCTVLGSV